MDSSHTLSEHYPVKNYCPICCKLLPSNDKLFSHMYEHNINSYSRAVSPNSYSRAVSPNSYSRAVSPNPYIIKASQQQITDGTINNMYRKSNHIKTNMDQNAAIQNQDKRTVIQNNKKRASHVLGPFVSHAIPNDDRNARIQSNFNNAFNKSVQLRNDNKGPYTNSHNNVGRGTSGYQQETNPILRPNLSHNDVQCPPAKTNAVGEHCTIIFENPSELERLLIGECTAQKAINDPMLMNDHGNIHSTHTDTQTTNAACDASQLQPRVAAQRYQKPKKNKNNTASNVEYMCRLCFAKFDNKIDATKHRNRHKDEDGIKIEKYEKIILTVKRSNYSQRWDNTVEKNEKPTQQISTALVLPQAQPQIATVTILIDDDEEPQNYSHMNSSQAPFQYQTDEHPQQSQLHTSQIEHAEVTNTNLLTVRDPETVNNLVYSVNTDTELSLTTNQHYNTNNYNNTNNNIDENTYKTFETQNKRSHLCSDDISLNEDDGRENEKHNLNAGNRNMLQCKDQHIQNKRLKCNEYDASKSNYNQNNNTISAIENCQKSSSKQNKGSELCSDDFSSNIEEPGEYESDIENQNENRHKSETIIRSSKTDIRSESSSEDDASNDDNIIKEKKLIRIEESKTKKQTLSDGHEESAQCDSLPVNHDILNKIEKIKPTSIMKTSLKNVLNSKKSDFSTVKDKKMRPKSAVSSPLQKQKEFSRKNLQRESDERQILNGQKKRKREISKDITNQNRFNEKKRREIKDVITLYKCSLCDVCFLDDKLFENHLRANHKHATEPYLCTFCKYRFICSMKSFTLHMELHAKYAKINYLIIKNSIITDDTTPTASNNNFITDRNDLQLKECVVKLTALQSAHVSTTSNNTSAIPDANLEQPLNSQVHTDHIFPNLMSTECEENTVDHEDSQLSEELDLSNVSENRHKKEPQIPDEKSLSENSRKLENYAFFETTAVNLKDDLFTTEDTFEENLNNGEIKEYDPLIKNKIQDKLKNNIIRDYEDIMRNTVIVSNCSQKCITISSNVVVEEPRNLLEDSVIDKKDAHVNSTDTHLGYDKKEETPFILGDSNAMEDNDNYVSELLEKSELNFKKHNGLHKSAVNIITTCNKICEYFTPNLGTKDSCDSYSVLASNHTTESSSKPNQCLDNELTYSFDSDAVDDVLKGNHSKIPEITETNSKLTKDWSKSTEDLIKLLEEDLQLDTTIPDEVQHYHKFLSPLNSNTDIFETKDTVTVTKKDNVNDAENQFEIDYFTKKTSSDENAYITTVGLESSKAYETGNINIGSINISRNDPEIVTINDDSSDENELINETNSPFIDDLYEIYTETNSNDVNQRKLGRKPINIKIPTIKFTTVSPHINPGLPELDEDLIESDSTISSSTNVYNSTTTVANDSDEFNRNIENVIANIKKEPDTDIFVSSSSSDDIIYIVSDDEL